jgi:hypothetical protein
MRGISRLAENLFALQGRLWSMEFVSYIIIRQGDATRMRRRNSTINIA